MRKQNEPDLIENESPIKKGKESSSSHNSYLSKRSILMMILGFIGGQAIIYSVQFARSEPEVRAEWVAKIKEFAATYWYLIAGFVVMIIAAYTPPKSEWSYKDTFSMNITETNKKRVYKTNFVLRWSEKEDKEDKDDVSVEEIRNDFIHYFANLLESLITKLEENLGSEGMGSQTDINSNPGFEVYTTAANLWSQASPEGDEEVRMKWNTFMAEMSTFLVERSSRSMSLERPQRQVQFAV